MNSYLYRIAWVVWIGGTVLIVLRWNNTVSAGVGWIGFAIALIGVGLSWIPHGKANRRIHATPLKSLDEAGVSDAEQDTAPDRRGA